MDEGDARTACSVLGSFGNKLQSRPGKFSQGRLDVVDFQRKVVDPFAPFFHELGHGRGIVKRGKQLELRAVWKTEMSQADTSFRDFFDRPWYRSK